MLFHFFRKVHQPSNDSFGLLVRRVRGESEVSIRDPPSDHGRSEPARGAEFAVNDEMVADVRRREILEEPGAALVKLHRD